MGMFDHITIDYPLPGDPPSFATAKGHAFQTKDLDCDMSTYHVDANGRIDIPGEFTGTIDFYSSNIVGSGPGVYTRNGEDAVTVEYRATFHKSQLHHLQLVERSDEPALPASEMRSAYRRPTPEEAAAWKAECNAFVVGGDAFVWWGGQPAGYAVKLVAAAGNQLCSQSDKHGLELLDRRDSGRTLFANEADAIASRAARNREWDEATARYDELLKSRAKDTA